MTKIDELMAIIANEVAAAERGAFDRIRKALEAALKPGGEPYGWVKSDEMKMSRRMGGSINLWREKFDCDTPVYLAAPPAQPDAKPGDMSLADKFSAMHANGDVWITTIAAAKLAIGAAPPAQTPVVNQQMTAQTPVPPRLTDEQIGNIHYIESECREQRSPMAFARAIERAVRKQFGVQE